MNVALRLLFECAESLADSRRLSDELLGKTLAAEGVAGAAVGPTPRRVRRRATPDDSARAPGAG